jgi:hypothetical protein
VKFMTGETQYAPDWEGVDQGGGKVVLKDADRDGFWAEFENGGRRVRVLISAQDLRDFGDAPDGKKAAHTEQVLRAILEMYINKRGVPPDRIDAKDLANHGLAALRKSFLAAS